MNGSSHISGLVAAPFTPMHPDGSLNLPIIDQQVDHLVRNGVIGAFICGTTGEGLSLSVAERFQIAAQWMASAGGRLRVIVHVGHSSPEDSRALAAHANSVSAHGIAALAPVFFRTQSIDALAEYCAYIAEAAPSLPFYYYHIPMMAGADVSMFEFLKIASRQIPNFAGIKFTHENLMDYRRCVEFEENRYDILFGRDEILLAALALGATGAVGSTYNYMAPVYVQMLNAFQKGDLQTARKLQSTAINIIAIMIRHGGLAAGKAMMKMAGLDCGPVRKPLSNLSQQPLDSLNRELQSVNFHASLSA